LIVEVAAAARRSRRIPLLLVVPAAAVAAAAVLPLVYLVVRVAGGGAAAWSLVDPGVTAGLVLDTVLLVAGVVGASLAIAVPLAWLVVRTDMPGRRAIAVLAALPLVIPSYVAALALLGALGPRGFLQAVLEGPFGVERLPEIYGYAGAVTALTLSTYPYVFLLAVSALRGLDPALEEAGRSLGHSTWSIVFRVTLPSLRPALLGSSLLVALYVISDFGAVSLMQYPTLTRSIFLQYETLFDRTAAAALSLVLVAITAALLVLEARWRGRARYFRSAPGAARRHAQIGLGRWRFAACAASVVVVGFFLVLPLAVLVYWAAQGVGPVVPVDSLWRAAVNSFSASAVAAAAAGVAVLPVAFLARRHRAGWTVGLERVSYTSNALPGIVIALALVFFAARYAGFVYQTFALLVFAYVVRFMPQALAATSSALEAVNPRVEEAARGLGRGPFAVLLTVTMRLVRPGILAGVALVFLSAMKELPATLLLRPTGFETLATEIWTQASLGAYSQAALPALLLVAVAAPFVWMLTGRRAWELGASG
jgi:iron(III) transport system permease protein